MTTLADAGEGSLRDAIRLLAASPDPTNSIGFSVSGTISLERSLGAIINNVSIAGNAVTVRRSTVVGTGDFRILQIGPGPGALQVDISQMTIGDTLGGGRADLGAGIYVVSGATCNLYQVSVIGNRAIGDTGLGGGIFNEGTLTVENSEISNNRATGDGAGIYNKGSAATLDIRFDTFIDYNEAIGSGGGIFIAAGSVTIDGSTAKDNKAGFAGGGILNEDGNLTLSNSPLSGNTAATGGGIFLGGGTAQLTSVTISGNKALWDGTADSGKGGGFRVTPGATLTLSTCTVSGNESGPPPSPWPGTAGGWVELGGIYTAIGCTILDPVQNDNP